MNKKIIIIALFFVMSGAACQASERASDQAGEIETKLSSACKLYSLRHAGDRNHVDYQMYLLMVAACSLHNRNALFCEAYTQGALTLTGTVIHGVVAFTYPFGICIKPSVLQAHSVEQVGKKIADNIFDEARTSYAKLNAETGAEHCEFVLELKPYICGSRILGYEVKFLPGTIAQVVGLCKNTLELAGVTMSPMPRRVQASGASYSDVIKAHGMKK